MKRRVIQIALACALAITPVLAQHEGEGHSGDSMTMWKWVNFGILFAGLGFLAMKFGGPAFKARGEGIRKELELARRIKSEAEAKIAGIESKLGHLSQDIEKFRQESMEMIAREGEKISRETAELLERSNGQTEQEVLSLTNAARKELKAEAARLALELAEKRIAQGLTPEAQASLVSAFTEDLKKAGA